MNVIDLFGTTRPGKLEGRIAEAKDILCRAIREFNPSHVFAMLSGGHDSLCASHIASQHPRFSGAVHINTGIGVEETRQFVRDTSLHLGWPLKEYQSHISYRSIVLEHGFPGPAGHSFIYRRLKERCIERLVREHKTHRRDRIVLVTGCRRAESERRMGTAVDIRRQGARVWTAPIINWLPEDKNDYIASHGLKRNRVVDTLCMSGECLCGAFAKPGEIVEIEAAYPKAAAVIRELESAARDAGVHAKWGTRPPQKPDPRQGSMDLCWSCEAMRAAE